MPTRRDPDALFAARKPTSKIPFDFVLQELADLGPYTRPMFACVAVYVEERIVFALRERGNPREDDGVWIATSREHHASLRREMPGLRSITVLGGGGETGWQILPVDSEDFEASVLRACELVRTGDPRVGKVPKRKKKKTEATRPPAKAKAGKRARRR